jgi:hypothetical protein
MNTAMDLVEITADFLYVLDHDVDKNIDCTTKFPISGKKVYCRITTVNRNRQ